MYNHIDQIAGQALPWASEPIHLREMEEEIPPDTVIYSEGDMADDVFLLVSGSVRIMRSQQVIDIVQEQYTPFGLVAALIHTHHSESARTPTAASAKVVRIPSEKLPAVFPHVPELGIKILQKLVASLMHYKVRYHAVKSREDMSLNRWKILSFLLSNLHEQSPDPGLFAILDWVRASRLATGKQVSPNDPMVRDLPPILKRIIAGERAVPQ